MDEMDSPLSTTFGQNSHGLFKASQVQHGWRMTLARTAVANSRFSGLQQASSDPGPWFATLGSSQINER